MKTLEQLVDCANFVVVDGYEIEEFADYGEMLRLACDDDNEWYFDPKQEVTLNSEGAASVEARLNPDDEETETVTMEFYMRRAMQETDV